MLTILDNMLTIAATASGFIQNNPLIRNVRIYLDEINPIRYGFGRKHTEIIPERYVCGFENSGGGVFRHLMEKYVLQMICREKGKKASPCCFQPAGDHGWRTEQEAKRAEFTSFRRL